MKHCFKPIAIFRRAGACRRAAFVASLLAAALPLSAAEHDIRVASENATGGTGARTININPAIEPVLSSATVTAALDVLLGASSSGYFRTTLSTLADAAALADLIEGLALVFTGTVDFEDTVTFDGVTINYWTSTLNMSSSTVTLPATVSGGLSSFASAAQGSLADTATQPGDALPWADVTGTPTTAAAYGITNGANLDLIDQDLSVGSNPTFDGANIMDIPGPSVDAATTSARGTAELSTAPELRSGEPDVVPSSETLDEVYGTSLRSKAAAGGVVNPVATFTDGFDIGTNDFTVCFEVKVADWTTTSQLIFWRSHDGGINRVEIGKRSTGSIGLTFTDGTPTSTTYYIAPTVALPDDEMVCLMVAADRDGDATLYVNGVANGTVDISSESALDIGSGNTNAGRLATFVETTTITEHAVLNTALTETDAKFIADYGYSAWLAENPEYARGEVDGGTYTSDFSAGADGFGNISSTTVTGNVDSIGGEDDVLSVERTTSSGVSTFRKDISGVYNQGDVYRITADYYIPSGNSNVDGVQWRYNGGSTTVNPSGTAESTVTVSATDTWETLSVFWTQSESAPANEDRLIIYPADGSVVSITGGNTDLVYVKNVKVTRLGTLAHLPMDEGNRDLKDTTPNRNDALLSETGATHLIPRERGSLRADNVDATGGAYLLEASDIINPDTAVTGVIVDGVYHAASGAQTETYRRIRLVTSGSDVLVQRSDGSTHETIATTTPSDTTDFNISVQTAAY